MKNRMFRGRWSAACLLAGVAAIALVGTANAADDTDTIIVTGSRIPKPDYANANPVTSLSAKQIEESGITDVTQLMQQIPALINSSDSNDNAGSNAGIGTSGLNLLNLRNLGVDRTLVLVNGRRHISGLPGSAAVDTNTIPVDLIKDVEVETGGASAIYGADAVTGVVNFIMKDNFEGLRLRGQGGTTQDGGGNNAFVSLTGGANFADGKGNIAIAGEYSRDGRITSQQRSYTNHETRFVRPPPGTQYDGVYDRAPFGNLGWFGSSTGGGIDIDGDIFYPEYDGNTGAAWDYGTYPDGLQGGTYQQGGSATPTSNYGGWLEPDIKRYDVNMFGHYDITPNIRFFTEMKYVQTKSLNYSQPTFDYALAITPDNYYLNKYFPGIAAAAVGNGFDLFYGLPDGSVLVNRDNFDLGVRGENVDRQTIRGVWGFDATVPDWGALHTSYIWSEALIDNLQINNRYNDRFAAALDAVDDGSGNPVCRSDLNPADIPTNADWQGWATPTSFTPGPNSGCQPIDIFGYGSPSAAAVNWIMTDSLAKSKLTQQDALAYFTGKLDPLFTLPAGSVGYSIGGEWRRETSNSTPAPEDQAGLTFNNVLAPVFGKYEVSEVFGEIEIPLLADLPFVKNLSIGGAERFSHYSTAGDTNTWNAHFSWSVIPDITFRGTHAKAVRAPNISELFDPGGQTFLFIDDPCDVNYIAQGTSYRAANCAALLAPLGVPDPNNFNDPNPGTSRPGIQKGNPGLDPETAITNTVGVVVKPRYIPHLTFSIDYYKIRLGNAINTLTAQDLADQCVDLPTINNEFCALLVRQNGGAHAGEIVDYTVEPVNVASYKTSGVDFSAEYSLDPADLGVKGDWGTFNFRLIGSWLNELSFVNLPGADPNPDKGEVDAPEWQGNFNINWDRGPFTVAYAFHYFSPTQRYSISSATQPRLTTLPKYQHISALETHDIQVRYDMSENLTLYGGINNLADQQPDLGEGTVGEPVSPYGRTFYVGLTAQIDAIPGL